MVSRGFCYICTQEGSWSLFLLYLYTRGFMVSVSAISVHRRVNGLFLLYLYTRGFMVSVSAISVHRRVHGL